MTQASTGQDQGWRAVLERFEQHRPASVMVRIALEQALPADWIDEMFQKHRRSQYTRELLFSTTIETMTLVALGLRLSHPLIFPLDVPASRLRLLRALGAAAWRPELYTSRVAPPRLRLDGDFAAAPTYWEMQSEKGISLYGCF